MRKIKLFLGAYVNFPNAQNINCDNIAKYIDKEKFEVHVMYTDRMEINKSLYKERGIYLHRLIDHRFIWTWCKYLTMAFGKYDIYYLPKREKIDSVFVRRHKKNAVFLSSVEGVVGEQIPGTDSEIRNKYLIMDDIFSISKCIKTSVKKFWNIDTEILYLGVDLPKEHKIHRQKINVKNIIWIGSVIERKRPEYLIECAEEFPQLQFTMIGDGEKLATIKKMVQKRQLKNFRLTGRISNLKVYDELENADLLLMTSNKEGLPKVIGEAMISGVPTIYINEHYDVDYIQNGVNGYAVQNLEEMLQKIQELVDNPQKYQVMSANALETISDYTWQKLIKEYERYFIEQYQKKSSEK